MATIDPKYRYTGFLHPRYWPTWLLIGLLYLVSLLPYRAQQKLGEWLGRRIYKLGGSRRRTATANIRACFPELSPEAQEQLVIDAFIANAKGYIECTVGWWRNLEPYYQKMEFHGLEHLQEAISRGKGVFLLGGHFSILDFAGPLLSQVTPVSYMYRPNNNLLFNAVIERSRSRCLERGFDKRQISQFVEYIKQGNVAWYACDQDFGTKNSVFAPFFGVQTATLTTPAWIARETGATVLQLSQFREGNGVYSLRFSPIFENYPSDDEVENATRMNKALEEAIRVHPDQYLWLHRRFKTRPEGEPSIY